MRRGLLANPVVARAAGHEAHPRQFLEEGVELQKLPRLGPGPVDHHQPAQGGERLRGKAGGSGKEQGRPRGIESGTKLGVSTHGVHHARVGQTRGEQPHRADRHPAFAGMLQDQQLGAGGDAGQVLAEAGRAGAQAAEAERAHVGGGLPHRRCAALRGSEGNPVMNLLLLSPDELQPDGTAGAGRRARRRRGAACRAGSTCAPGCWGKVGTALLALEGRRASSHARELHRHDPAWSCSRPGLRPCAASGHRRSLGVDRLVLLNAARVEELLHLKVLAESRQGTFSTGWSRAQDTVLPGADRRTPAPSSRTGWRGCSGRQSGGCSTPDRWRGAARPPGSGWCSPSAPRGAGFRSSGSCSPPTDSPRWPSASGHSGRRRWCPSSWGGPPFAEGPVPRAAGGATFLPWPILPLPPRPPAPRAALPRPSPLPSRPPTTRPRRPPCSTSWCRSGSRPAPSCPPG